MRGRRRRARGAPPTQPRAGTRRTSKAPGAAWPRALVDGVVDGLAHPLTPEQPRWRLALPVLALAFAVRAAIALAGDFALHPDEIMQYLEPAHRLAFGNGVLHWEQFYGARSWLVPGAVAGVLRLFALAGLGEPFWYVGGVKLAFCALSLAIPAAMYCFARRHFGETTARVALVAGAFWYELAGFAHKPLTEFVATAPLIGLLALSVRPALDRPRTVWLAAALAVLAGAIRLQYAPVAVVLLGIVFLRTRQKTLLALAAAVLCCAVGIFDAVTWDGGLFHSYVVNLRFNLILGELRAGESPPYQYLWWLTVAGGGLSVLCLAAALRRPRRYGLLVGLIVLVLLAHSLQAHKEYRFVFAVIPLWLLLGADLAARAAAWCAARRPACPGAARWPPAAAGALLAAVSVAGVLNALPAQERVYRAWSGEIVTGFVRGHDPIFAAYRYLARAPGVGAVWQADRPYFQLPGYYYLHRAIPFYDAFTGRGVNRDLATVTASVSHIVAADAEPVPGYSLDRAFGAVRILRRDAAEPPVRRWREYAPVVVDDFTADLMRQVDAGGPAPPANAGIRFATGGERE